MTRAEISGVPVLPRFAVAATAAAVLAGPVGVANAEASPATHAGSSAVRVTVLDTTHLDRSRAGALAGRTVSGASVVFARVVGAAVREVDFRIDRGGWHRDRQAPFDLVGGTARRADSWNSSRLTPGRHVLTTRVVTRGQGTRTVTADFTVAAPAVPMTPAAMAGMPSAANTGPVGPLRPSGSLTITRPGVYFGLDVHGHIDVESPGVTLTDIRVDAADAFYAIRNDSGSHLTITNCDLGPSGVPTHETDAAVVYSDYTLERCNVHGTGDGLKAHGNTVIEDDYIHDMFESDGNHSDGIQVSAGSNIVIEHNTIVSAPVDSAGSLHQGVSCVMVKSDQGPISNVLIEANSLGGDPGFLLYDRAGTDFPTPTGVDIVDNDLGPRESAPGAGNGYVYGTLSADSPAPTLVGNVRS